MGLLAKPNYAYLHDCLTGCLHGHLANKRFYAQIGGRHTWLSTKGIVASKVSIKSLCTVAGFSQIIYCLSPEVNAVPLIKYAKKHLLS